MFEKNIYHRPNKGPLWKWILIAGMMLILSPFAWVLGKFIGKQKSAEIFLAFIPDW